MAAIDPVVVSIALVPLAVLLTLLATLWLNHRSERLAAVTRVNDAAEAEIAARGARITKMETELALVTQSVANVSALFQAVLVKELTHFHAPRPDELMEKLSSLNGLSPDEEVELVAILKSRAEEMNGLLTESERDAAVMLPMVAKRVKAEAALGIINGCSYLQRKAVVKNGGVS